MTNIECKDTFFLTTNKEINTFFLTNCGEDIINLYQLQKVDTKNIIGD